MKKTLFMYDGNMNKIPIDLLIKYHSETEWEVFVNGESQGIYKTNKVFDGLWFNQKQIIGTCDFSLSANEKYRKRQIRKFMVEKYSDGVLD